MFLHSSPASQWMNPASWRAQTRKPARDNPAVGGSTPSKIHRRKDSSQEQDSQWPSRLPWNRHLKELRKWVKQTPGETVFQAEGRAKASLALGCLVNSKNRDAGVAGMGLLGVGGRSWGQSSRWENKQLSRPEQELWPFLWVWWENLEGFWAEKWSDLSCLCSTFWSCVSNEILRERVGIERSVRETLVIIQVRNDLNQRGSVAEEDDCILHTFWRKSQQNSLQV